MNAPLWRSPVFTLRFLLTCFVQAVVMGLLLEKPLYWAMHFEFAFLSNLWLVFVAGPWVIASCWQGPGIFQSEGGLVTGLWRMLIQFGIALAMILGAQVFIGTCDVLEGLAWFALLPGVGVLFAGAIAAFCAYAATRRRRAYWFYLVVVLFSLAVVGLRIYFGIPFRSYSLLAGFWPGVLYDEYVPIEAPLLIARLEALLLAAGILLVLTAQVREKAHRLIPALVCFALFGIVWQAEGYWEIHPSRARIEKELGLQVTSKHATWVADHQSADVRRNLPLLMARFDYQAEQVAAELGIDPLPKMKVYLFSSAQQKRRIVGAEHTVITRPWLGELYLHDGPRAQKILRHELVHLVAARWARAGLGISPNIALLEGLAVSLQGGIENVATSEGLASAAIRQESEFQLEVFLSGASFWSYAPEIAYPMAGAFVDFARARNPAGFPGFYRRGTPAGLSELQLAEEWRNHLKEITPTPAETALATRLMARRPLHLKRCAHEVAQCLHGEGDVLWGGDENTKSLVQRALRLDPQRIDVRALSAQIALQAGDEEVIRKELPADLDSSEIPQTMQLQAVRTYTQRLLAEGRFEEAIPWLRYGMRWFADLEALWQMAAGEAFALAGGLNTVIFQSPRGWDLSCRLSYGRPVCEEIARGDVVIQAVGAVHHLSRPEVELAAASSEYNTALASHQFGKAALWSDRIARIKELPPKLLAEAAHQRDEANWLATHYKEYEAKVPTEEGM